jgi:hypothetical protein
MLFTLFLACNDADPSGDSEPTDDASRALDAADRELLDAHVAALEGVWIGEANPTPLGAIPFGIALERKGDAIVGVSKQMGTSLSFAFEPDATHGFRFTESGTFAGFTQSYVLAPVEASADSVRWVALEDPEVLEVVTTVSATSLTLEAWVRGEPHATLTLDRS